MAISKRVRFEVLRRDNNTCEIEGCDQPRYQRRVLCSAHAMRKHRYGDPFWERPVRSADLTGKRFGSLIAIERATGISWRCRCDCGVWATVRTSSLTGEVTRSCGQHRRAEDVGYSGVHSRLRIDQGPAADYACVDCGQRAAQWSYSHEDPDERQSPDGPYSLNPDHYAPRCVPCHKVMDLAILGAR